MRKQHYITIGNNLVPIDYAKVREANLTFLDWIDALHGSARVNDDLVYRPPRTEGIPVAAVVIPEVERVIVNYPATIVFWTDGTKTIVKCNPEDSDKFSAEHGITLCYMKKMLGNTSGALNNTLRDAVKKADIVCDPNGGDKA